MGISVRVLQANHGDCFLVSYKSSDSVYNLLIDGGNSATFMFGLKGATVVSLNVYSMI